MTCFPGWEIIGTCFLMGRAIQINVPDVIDYLDEWLEVLREPQSFTNCMFLDNYPPLHLMSPFNVNSELENVRGH